jgi:hypothetical protein
MSLKPTSYIKFDNSCAGGENQRSHSKDQLSVVGYLRFTEVEKLILSKEVIETI